MLRIQSFRRSLATQAVKRKLRKFQVREKELRPHPPLYFYFQELRDQQSTLPMYEAQRQYGSDVSQENKHKYYVRALADQWNIQR